MLRVETESAATFALERTRVQRRREKGKERKRERKNIIKDRRNEKTAGACILFSG